MSICPIDFRLILSYNASEVIQVVDYKEMYFKLFRATADAIEVLEAAQQECEELYISAEEPTLTLFPGGDDLSKTGDSEK